MSDQCEHGQLRSGAVKTPLLDLLSGVPEDARAEHKVSEFHSHYIPYGRLCKEAHDEIKRLTAELDELRKKLRDEELLAREFHDRYSAELTALNKTRAERDAWRKLVLDHNAIVKDLNRRIKREDELRWPHEYRIAIPPEMEPKP